MKFPSMSFVCGMVLFLVLTVPVMSTDRWVFGSGGGPVSTGSMQLDGTIGQPVIGLANNGAVELSSGFWFSPSSGGPTSFGVQIDMPSTAHPFQPFWVNGLLINTGSPRTDVPTFFILDVYGQYWFWPGWRYYSPPEATEIDYDLLDVPSGTTTVHVIPEITWPDTGDDTVPGLYFYGAFLTPDLSAIDGDWSAREWGYSP